MLSPVTLLVAAALLVGVRSMSSSTTVCATERAACLVDTVCNDCLSGPDPTDYCIERYPSIFHSGSAGEGPDYVFCDATGASYCCDHTTEDISNECLTNSASIAYWTCVMEDEGCVVGDMPCFQADTTATRTPAPITPAPVISDPTSTPVAVAPVAAPTAGRPDTVDFANGAPGTFGFRRSLAFVVGLVVASLFC